MSFSPVSNSSISVPPDLLDSIQKLKTYLGKTIKIIIASDSESIKPIVDKALVKFDKVIKTANAGNYPLLERVSIFNQIIYSFKRISESSQIDGEDLDETSMELSRTEFKPEETNVKENSLSARSSLLANLQLCRFADGFASVGSPTAIDPSIGGFVAIGEVVAQDQQLARFGEAVGAHVHQEQVKKKAEEAAAKPAPLFTPAVKKPAANAQQPNPPPPPPANKPPVAGQTSRSTPPPPPARLLLTAKPLVRSLTVIVPNNKASAASQEQPPASRILNTPITQRIFDEGINHILSGKFGEIARMFLGSRQSQEFSREFLLKIFFLAWTDASQTDRATAVNAAGAESIKTISSAENINSLRARFLERGHLLCSSLSTDEDVLLGFSKALNQAAANVQIDPAILAVMKQKAVRASQHIRDADLKAAQVNAQVIAAQMAALEAARAQAEANARAAALAVAQARAAAEAAAKAQAAAAAAAKAQADAQSLTWQQTLTQATKAARANYEEEREKSLAMRDPEDRRYWLRQDTINLKRDKSAAKANALQEIEESYKAEVALSQAVKDPYDRQHCLRNDLIERIRNRQQLLFWQ